MAGIRDPKGITDKLREIFPLDKYETGSTWTKQGSHVELPEEIQLHVQKCLRDFPKKCPPKVGVIYFERLDDGGYQINHIKSQD